MRIALLADIHSNFVAFEAAIADITAWAPDLTIVAGDVINRGPDGRECLLRALELRDAHGWYVIRGNHEGYVLRYDHDHRLPEFLSDQSRRDLTKMTAWTHMQVADLIAEIRALPEDLRIETPHGPLVTYHASVKHDRDGIYRGAALDLIRTQIDPSAAVFGTAHTHVPHVVQVDQTLVVNCGSVGLPFDNDTRPSYARLTWESGRWQAQIRRIDYDHVAAEQRYHDSGMMAMVGPLALLMLREHQTAKSYIFDFVPAYRDKILAGTISLSDAVEAFLHSQDRAA